MYDFSFKKVGVFKLKLSVSLDTNIVRKIPVIPITISPNHIAQNGGSNNLSDNFSPATRKAQYTTKNPRAIPALTPKLPLFTIIPNGAPTKTKIKQINGIEYFLWISTQY